MTPPLKTNRSAFMRQIRTKDTAPEIAVRRVAFGLGYRYRLHVKELPGRPDLVFPSRRKVIFVHGCFWHQHTCKHGSTMSKTNPEFWSQKLAANVERDRKKETALLSHGWSVLVIWECQTKDLAHLAEMIQRFLDHEDCNAQG